MPVFVFVFVCLCVCVCVRTGSALALLYGTSATLEHHHFNHAVMILQSEVHFQYLLQCSYHEGSANAYCCMLLFLRHIQTLATTKFNSLTSLTSSTQHKVFDVFAAASCTSIVPKMRRSLYNECSDHEDRIVIPLYSNLHDGSEV